VVGTSSVVEGSVVDCVVSGEFVVELVVELSGELVDVLVVELVAVLVVELDDDSVVIVELGVDSVEELVDSVGS